MHDENCFVTLTYRDESLPPFGSLSPRDLQLFLKRLRKAESGGIRFFACGEYGSRSLRPHYHLCLFGYDPADKVRWTTRNGYPVWRSDSLERLWPHGQSEIGSVTFQSAAYVARYIVKKRSVNVGMVSKRASQGIESATGEFGERVPEFSRQSRRPGIGKPWIEKFACEVYPSDGVVVRGRLVKPPRYYDQHCKERDPGSYEAVLQQRRRMVNPSDQTEERLHVREKVAESRYKTFNREVL